MDFSHGTEAALPAPLAALDELATNLRWTWDLETQRLFHDLDPVIWRVTGDPLAVVRGLDPARVAALAEDDDVVGQVAEAAARLHADLADARWADGLADRPRLVAYFSPEFGLSETLPQYSGGLGVLAGDHLKAASDLGVPLVAVGLYYRDGYFSQRLDAHGRQTELYARVDPARNAVEPVLAADGSRLTVAVAFPDGAVQAALWRVRVGRIELYLLDTDLDANRLEDRAITDRLYGGDVEHRLRQELILGVGGVRALRALGLRPDVFHMNEGHAALLGVERLRELVDEDGATPVEALERVRATSIFTTHTPVPAGIDRFPRALVERYFGRGGVGTSLGVEGLMELGREPKDADGAMLSMAVLAIRLAARVNGVSRLHGAVSREMFSGVFPGVAVDDVPIGHVTNGVHLGTWVAPPLQALFRDRLGWTPTAEDATDWAGAERLDDAALWQARGRARAALVEEVRRRTLMARADHGHDAGLDWIEGLLDADALTIGFARRAATYKRLSLLLRERERLTRLLVDRERPLQLVLAGKAHPRDDGGKELIRAIGEFAADPAVRTRVVYLENYDMALGRLLTAGVDVWLNTPIRPLEASGTSGMKAALNGVPNLSIRDGWWDEGYDGTNGWAIPSSEDPDDDARDRAEAASLLDLIAEGLLPEFHDRDADGVPRAWTKRMKRSIGTTGAVMSASRMVRQYATELYGPASADARALGL